MTETTEQATSPAEVAFSTSATGAQATATLTPSATETVQAAATTQATEENPELARLQKELEKVRREAASHRVKLKEFEDSQKTEQERLADELNALKAERADILSKAKAAAANAAITAAAAELGIKPSLATRLVTLSDLEFDDATGDIKAGSAKKSLQQIAKENPELTGAVSGGASNPGRGGMPSASEREAELRQMLRGGGATPFGIENAQANPVVFSEKAAVKAGG